MTNSQDILFSIIVPTYNRAGMIGKAIESVLTQTYPNWELIIIDDGSIDNTVQIINSYNDNRVLYFYQKNSGKSVARNLGIEKSKGDFIAFLDDDDYYLPDFLLNFYQKIKEKYFNSTLLMCGQFEKIGEEELKEIEINKNKIQKNHIKYLITYSNNLQPFVISKDILKNERFDERFNIGEDFHLLIRLLFKANFQYIPYYLCVYVNHKEMIMEKELKDGLFLTLPYNRLDVLNDIENNYFELLKNIKSLKSFYDRYNKIAYFYASTAMRKNKIKYAFELMKSIRWGGTFYKVFYYKLSIFVRLGYYRILFLLKGK